MSTFWITLDRFFLKKTSLWSHWLREERWWIVTDEVRRRICEIILNWEKEERNFSFIILYLKYSCCCCDSVGRAIASNSRDPWFESSHRKILFSMNCFEKPKIKKKRPEWPIKNNYFWSRLMMSFLKMDSSPASFCLFSFFSNSLQNKSVHFTGFWTWIVRVEGKHADHFTTPTAYCFLW